MTLNRLLYACRNFHPRRTAVKIVDCKTHDSPFFGAWSDAVEKMHGRSTVIDFAIDKIMPDGYANQITAYVITVHVKREEDAPCATQ